MRKPFIAGNWKMHKSIPEALELAGSLRQRLKDVEEVDIAVFPPFTSLFMVSKALEGSNIKLGAQNVFYENEGAFTGEISPNMLLDVGCSLVIVGHSERRHIFGETDQMINRKLVSAQNNGLIPILCVGERLEEREEGKTFDVIKRQVREGLKGANPSFIIAYEPVWAIGTGKTATPEQAQEVHLFIRGLIEELFGKDTAQRTRILYGGSVKPHNIEGLMSMPDIDGALVGGASLKAEDFEKIVKFGGR